MVIYVFHTTAVMGHALLSQILLHTTCKALNHDLQATMARFAKYAMPNNTNHTMLWCMCEPRLCAFLFISNRDPFSFSVIGAACHELIPSVGKPKPNFYLFNGWEVTLPVLWAISFLPPKRLRTFGRLMWLLSACNKSVLTYPIQWVQHRLRCCLASLEKMSRCSNKPHCPPKPSDLCWGQHLREEWTEKELSKQTPKSIPQTDAQINNVLQIHSLYLCSRLHHCNKETWGWFKRRNYLWTSRQSAECAHDKRE